MHTQLEQWTTEAVNGQAGPSWQTVTTWDSADLEGWDENLEDHGIGIYRAQLVEDDGTAVLVSDERAVGPIYSSMAEVEAAIIDVLGEHAEDVDVAALAADAYAPVRTGNAARDGFAQAVTDEQWWTLTERVDHAITLEQLGQRYADVRAERRAAVVAAVEAGMPKARAAALAGVSRPTVDKWLEG